MRGNYSEKKALFYLENPLIYSGLPPKKKPQIVLMLWQYPSFFPYVSWSIIADQNKYTVRRILWDRKPNLVPEPNLYGAEGFIPNSLVEEVKNSLQTISLPLCIPAPKLGLDGARYGLDIQTSGFSAKISWWDVAIPAEWQPIHIWHSNTVALLEPYLPTH